MARNLTYTATTGLERKDALGMLASAGLFLLPAAMVSTPFNVLPFALVLLLTSARGFSDLWRVRAGVIAPIGYTRGTNPRHHADVARVYASRVVAA